MKATIRGPESDPHGLGPRFREYCRAELLELPKVTDATERQRLAAQLLRRFLGTLPVSMIASAGLSIAVEL